MLSLFVKQPAEAITTIGCQSMTLAEFLVEDTVGLFEIA
jgi:hypothetical protein